MSDRYIPLGEMDISPSIDDLFWQEKVKRAINDTSSASALRDISVLLLELTVKRQAIVRSLIKDMFELHGITITHAGLEDIPEAEK